MSMVEENTAYRVEAAEKDTGLTETAEVATGTVDMEEDEYMIIFRKPYNFEGTVYEKIDLIGLDSLTAEDMIKVNRIMEKTNSFSILPEMTLEYACRIAAIATKMPYEFFTNMHPKEAVRVKNRVTSFFYGTD